MLKLWGEKGEEPLPLLSPAESGLICLKYLDESGFERSSPLTYTYAQRGVQKPIRQPRNRGQRISALGLWEPGRGFEYGLVVGGFNSNRYITLMTWQACRAAKRLVTTGQLTVIIQDRASSHKSKLVKQHCHQWQEQGLLIFFLPPYSPQMNRIEDEWLHLKREEFATRLFDDEYDLAIAVMDAIEHRANVGSYTVERFRFNRV